MPRPKSTKRAPARKTSSAKLKGAASPKRPIAVKRSSSGSRVLQTPKRIWYKPLTWKNRPPRPVYQPLPKARKLLTQTFRQLWTNWKLFGGIALVYGVLNLLLVRGLSGSSDLSTIKSALDSVVHGAGGRLASAGASFLYLLSTSASSNSANSGIYQTILLVVCSLAFIWALRQTLAKRQVGIRDSFYQGMYPLVPFLLILLIIGIQLIPLAIGGGLYSLVISGGIAVHAWEKVLWLILFIGLGLWSLRMFTSSLLALYIVTLPDLTPLKALRSARQLVVSRRLLIWRKLIFLPVALLMAAALVELPLILFATIIAPWVFFVFSTLALVVAHGYIYNLYRELL